jgi:putative membrane protein insertion efficiency factor
MKLILIVLIKIYQNTISRVLPASCRFYPSCSQYMITAIKQYPLPQALWLGLKRLGKCHPYHPGGIDEVPIKG